MKFRTWIKKRGLKFIWQRGNHIIKRQGLTPDKAVRRIEKCVETLAQLNCAPTFPTPGVIVQRYPKFIRQLQQMGVEIAVHSYHHINLNEVPIIEAKQQLIQAIRTFEHFGIEVHGFRCPYLGYSAELLDSLPDGMFKYSSNEAVYWHPNNLTTDGNHFYEAVGKFYGGRSASGSLCIPKMQSHLIEIPVCVPDDIQLCDGLCLDSDGIFEVWSQIQDAIYRRGELFTLVFHPELATLCNRAFISLMNYINQLRPAVWVARLKEISEWWQEKSQFAVEVTSDPKELIINFTCSPQATILVRGLNLPGSVETWDRSYSRLLSNTMVIPSNIRPFVGLANDIPKTIVSFLQEQGYIVEAGETAHHCSVFLDKDTLAGLSTNLELVECIESSQAPLVRFWRWPNGAKSALSITGDLDALSIMDFVSRIFI